MIPDGGTFSPPGGMREELVILRSLPTLIGSRWDGGGCSELSGSDAKDSIEFLRLPAYRLLDGVGR